MRDLTASLALAGASFLFVACGDDGGGSAADAGDEVDATDIDGAPASTTCGVVAPTFLVGNAVVFSTSTGGLIGVEYLDVDRTASRDDCGPNTMITIAAVGGRGGFRPLPYSLLTVAGVQGGDTVYIGSPEGNDAFSSSVNISTSDTIPVGLFDTPTERKANIGCNTSADPGVGPTPNLQTTAFQSCLGTDGNIDAVAYLTNAGGLRVAYDFQKDVPGVNAGLTEFTMTNWRAFAATAENPRSAVTVTNAPMWADTARAYESHFVDGIQFEAGSTSTGDFRPMGALLPVLSLPPGFGETTVASAIMEGYDVDNRYLQSMSTVGPYSDSHSFDFSGALPRIARMTATSDGQRLTYKWLADDSLAGADIMTLQAYGEFGEWQVFFPGTGGTTFVTPILPDSLADVVPSASGLVIGSIAAAGESPLIDYHELITNPSGLFIRFASTLPLADLVQLPSLEAGTARRTAWILSRR